MDGRNLGRVDNTPYADVCTQRLQLSHRCRCPSRRLPLLPVGASAHRDAGFRVSGATRTKPHASYCAAYSRCPRSMMLTHSGGHIPSPCSRARTGSRWPGPVERHVGAFNSHRDVAARAAGRVGGRVGRNGRQDGHHVLPSGGPTTAGRSGQRCCDGRPDPCAGAAVPVGSGRRLVGSR
jgi:hypothetical protein